MIIGVPSETKDGENRVGIVPAGVKSLVEDGHEVYIQKDAGLGSGIKNEEYTRYGAKLLDTPKEVYEVADMIMKVKEPQEEEFEYLQEDQILFCFLHLAAEEAVTKALAEKNVTAIAYETIDFPEKEGYLPLNTPMSEISGRLAVQFGAQYLNKNHGDRGVLLGGIPGVDPGKVVILGAGTVGQNAAKIAVGFEADVTVINRGERKLRYINDIYQGRVKTLKSNEFNIHNAVKDADLVVGAVLIPGAACPKLLTEEMIKDMPEGSVIVDVCIDQGGVAETSKVTYHSDPVYEKHGVLHYGVTNMPGSVPRTSSFGLTKSTLSYAKRIVNEGFEKAMAEDPGFAMGMNVYKGHVVYEAVAEALDMEYTPLEELLDLS